MHQMKFSTMLLVMSIFLLVFGGLLTSSDSRLDRGWPTTEAKIIGVKENYGKAPSTTLSYYFSVREEKYYGSWTASNYQGEDTVVITYNPEDYNESLINQKQSGIQVLSVGIVLFSIGFGTKIIKWKPRKRKDASKVPRHRKLT